jgi:penicillin-binding protein 2
LGSKLGVDKIAKWSRAFGLGEKTGVDLDDERSGIIPDTEWKRKRFRQPWYPGETLSVAIGQGYVTTTPLQLANMMVAVANGGKLYRPRLVHKVESVDGATVREYEPELIRAIELKRDTLTRVHKALADVVNGPGGTGAPARSQAIDIAGKTGTAQVVEMKGAYLKNEQLSQFQRDHAWFVAYAPAQNPRIAVAVLVEHGGHGSAAAAPLAKQVFERFVDSEKQITDKQQVRLNGETSAD